MWAQLVVEAVAGSGLAVGMAYRLAHHARSGDPTSPAPVAVRGGTATPRPAVVTGEAFERVWAQAEQVGWHRLLAAGVLHPVGRPAADPGNPAGSRLVLAEHVSGAFGDCRILLGLNGSPDADGSYELVAIPVPSTFDDALAAAAWTYDDPDHPVRCTRQGYADTARRT
jgi:hypothetical protein